MALHSRSQEGRHPSPPRALPQLTTRQRDLSTHCSWESRAVAHAHDDGALLLLLLIIMCGSGCCSCFEPHTLVSSTIITSTWNVARGQVPDDLLMASLLLGSTVGLELLPQLNCWAVVWDMLKNTSQMHVGWVEAGIHNAVRQTPTL